MPKLLKRGTRWYCGILLNFIVIITNQKKYNVITPVKLSIIYRFMHSSVVDRLCDFMNEEGTRTVFVTASAVQLILVGSADQPLLPNWDGVMDTVVIPICSNGVSKTDCLHWFIVAFTQQSAKDKKVIMQGSVRTYRYSHLI